MIQCKSSFVLQTMNLFRNTILICLLLTPVFVYAFSKQPVEELQEIESPVEVEIVEEEPVLTEKELIKKEIQEVFGDKWKLAYAVVQSEGGFNPSQKSHKSYYCQSLGRQAWDYGIFQFSECWHPEVSYECATNIACSTKEAYRVSKGGKDWRQWYGWLNGSYKKFL